MSDQPTPEKQPTSERLLTEGILVGAATALGYTIAYVYERAYAQALEIPVRFVSVTLAGGGVVAFRLFAIGFVGLALFRLAVTVTHSESARRYGLRRIAIVATFVVVMCIVHHFDLNQVIIFISVFLVILTIHFGVPAITKMPGTKYLQRLAAGEDATAASPNLLVPSEWLGPRVTLYSLIGLYVLYIAHAAGAADAKSQTQFLVSADDTRQVVLQIYDSRIIFGRLAVDGGVELDPELSVATLSEDSVLHFTRRTIGPLIVSPARDARLAVDAGPEPDVRRDAGDGIANPLTSALSDSKNYADGGEN